MSNHSNIVKKNLNILEKRKLLNSLNISNEEKNLIDKLQSNISSAQYWWEYYSYLDNITLDTEFKRKIIEDALDHIIDADIKNNKYFLRIHLKKAATM